MKYGEEFTITLKDWKTGKTMECKAVYKYAEWKDWHTDNEGNGLWYRNKQILGTCDFSVAGCKTEKAAKAKIRRYETR